MKRLITVTAALLIAFAGFPTGTSETAQAYPGAYVQLEGAGWGHGRGMGQHGALGYAVNHGSNHNQILGHFYSNTGSANIGSPTMTVRLTAHDNRPTIAYSPGGLRVPKAGISNRPAVLVQRASNSLNNFHVWRGPGCGGEWTFVQTVSNPVDIRPASGGASNFVRTCEPNGGTRAYRGYLWATRDSEGPQRTVNVVSMQSYLKGVVPRESPASWGDLGGGRGMNALRAQAVAARSYAQSENRYSYAKTCDTTACQVYGGYALNGTVLEHPNTNAAIDQTNGVVRTLGGASARAEFSSSTGGYSAGGTFPAVRDDGDAISLNPNHRWSARIPVTAVESAYPEIGRLNTVDVTRRNGLGAWGGRVLEVVLRGTSGSRALSGNEFRSRFGLKSDWFRVVSNPSGGVIGYWVLDNVGGIFSFGNAKFHGSLPQLRASGVPIGPSDTIDVAPTPSGGGYWVLDSAGGIFSFGDARFFGSVPGLREQGRQIGQARIIDLAPTPSGKGYWILDDQGGMFAFGDARFFGSVPGLRREGRQIGPAQVMAMTPTRTGNGYWMVDHVGGVFAFGDARFHGSLPALRNAGVQIGRADIVGVAASRNGYWMIDSRGGVFAFGDAGFHGSLPGAGIGARAEGIAPTKTGNGYLMVTAEGADVYSFGDAPDFGGVPDTGVSTTGRGIAARWRR